MRYLVTGGAGFIGSNLALALESQGHSVIVLDDFSSGHFQNLANFKGDVIAEDISEPGSLVKAGRVDGIFHQAAITDTTVTDQKRMMRGNVEGFRNVLRFALETKASVVYASSAALYGNGPCPMTEAQAPQPMNVYAFSKMVMDQLAARFVLEHPEISLMGLRYFNVYGPREGFKRRAASMIYQLAEQMRSGKRPRIFQAGEQSRDFVYVQDAVEANLKALKSGRSGVVNVCTGKGVTFNRIIDILNRVLGVSYEPEYFENPYPFYQNETLGDPSEAESQTGFKARFSIEQGIEDHLNTNKKILNAPGFRSAAL